MSSRSQQSGRSSKSKGGSLVRSPLSTGNLSISPALAHAFWDAAIHTAPPNIPTTYGNFTVVNSVARFAITTNTNTPYQFQVSWSPSSVRVTSWHSLLTNNSRFTAWQQAQLDLTNTAPLDIRPLRMSMKVRNTSSGLYVAGNIVAVLIPQSIILSYVVGVAPASPAASAATLSTLWKLCEDNPKSVSYTGAELAKGAKTFVMPPSSFAAYNSYQDWIPLSATDGLPLIDTDWLALSGLSSLPVAPYTSKSGWLGDIPPLYILLVNIEPNAIAQNYEIEVFSQDACRFPANSLVASMATRAPGRTLDMGALAGLANLGATGFGGRGRSGNPGGTS